MSIGNRPLIDAFLQEIREGPEEAADEAAGILGLLFERDVRRKIVGPHDYDGGVSTLVGRQYEDVDLDRDDLEYILQSFLDMVESDPPPSHAVFWALEKAHDERVQGPLLRFIEAHLNDEEHGRHVRNAIHSLRLFQGSIDDSVIRRAWDSPSLEVREEARDWFGI